MMGEGDQEWAARSAWRPGAWSTTRGGELGDTDDAAVEHVLAHAYERISMRILAYCVVSNHWRRVLWSSHDGDLSRFKKWMTRAERWR